MNSTNQPYHTLRNHYRERFGEPVHRVTLRGGFTCPNRDGTKGRGGCAFCSVEASAAPLSTGGATPSILQQLKEGMERIGPRFGVKLFMAYFNDYSATYAPVETLEALYSEALSHEQVVGLAVGTRPDCLPPEVLDLLAHFASKTCLWVELGLQTASQETLDLVGRGHTIEEFTSATRALDAIGALVCAHVILGLPGEGREQYGKTAALIRSLPIAGVKIHNLHILRGSRWEKDYNAGLIKTPTIEEHAHAVVDFLEQIPPRVVVHRIIGDAPAKWLVAPKWCLQKQNAIRAVRSLFQKRNTWQGKDLEPHEHGKDAQPNNHRAIEF